MITNKKVLFIRTISAVVGLASLILMVYVLFGISCFDGKIYVGIDSSVTYNEALSDFEALGSTNTEPLERSRSYVTILTNVPMSYRDVPEQGVDIISQRNTLIEYLTNNNVIQNCTSDTLDEYTPINRKNYSYLSIKRNCLLDPDMRPDKVEDFLFDYMFETNYRNINNYQGDRERALTNANRSFQIFTESGQRSVYGISYSAQYVSALGSIYLGEGDKIWLFKTLLNLALHPGLSADHVPQSCIMVGI